MPDRIITPRRTLQQIVHTAQEALSQYENNEDPRCIRDDLRGLQELVIYVMKTIGPMADGAERGYASLKE